MFNFQGLEPALLGLIGLLIGSFLNVVVYRLPRMLEAQWRQDCEGTPNAAHTEAAPFNLSVPRSRCPHCQHSIAWHQNIPVLSYVWLRGQCASCRAPIAVRYPLVELATGALFAACTWHWGLNASGLAWCGFSAALLVLALIDWDTTLLPDDITLPLLWAGLIASAWQLTGTNLHSALWGAVAGYLLLWSIYWLFKLVTGKEGMGYGDFKLLAALGAWLGWQALIPLILMASILGAVVGIAMKLSTGLRPGGYVPFGPFLAIAGMTSLAFGPASLLAWLGF
jgi:leader peptidase (prepilin peptidase)/N-methyltransferase